LALDFSAWRATVAPGRSAASPTALIAALIAARAAVATVSVARTSAVLVGTGRAIRRSSAAALIAVAPAGGTLGRRGGSIGAVACGGRSRGCDRRPSTAAIAGAGRASSERSRRYLAGLRSRRRLAGRRLRAIARRGDRRTSAAPARSQWVAVARRAFHRVGYWLGGSGLRVRCARFSLAQPRRRPHHPMTTPPVAQPQGVPLRFAFCARLSLGCTSLARRGVWFGLGGLPLSGLLIRTRPGQLRRTATAPPATTRPRCAVLRRRGNCRRVFRSDCLG